MCARDFGPTFAPAPTARVVLDLQNAEGRTAMHAAAINGHAAIVRMLIERGAATEILDVYGKTAQEYLDDALKRSDS